MTKANTLLVFDETVTRGGVEGWIQHLESAGAPIEMYRLGGTHVLPVSDVDLIDKAAFTGGPPNGTDADWVKQEDGTDRRCFTTTRRRENVLLQAKVCQSGNGGPAVNVLAGAMQNTLGQ